MKNIAKILCFVLSLALVLSIVGISTFADESIGLSGEGTAENPYLILVKAKDATITRCDVNTSTIAICDNAFYGCTELSVLNIPDSVKILVLMLLKAALL